MNNSNAGFKMLLGFVFLSALLFVNLAHAQEKAVVSLILKNNSSSAVEVALIDQYGGNFTVTINAGMSQNQSLKIQSPIKIAENVVHVVVLEDEAKEIIIAGQ
jgi:hypothetical protein